MPGTRLSDTLVAHIDAVESLVVAGIPAPPAWEKLRDYFTTNYQQQLTMRAADRLCEAVLASTADSDELSRVHALALAEQTTPQNQAVIDNRVGAAVERRLLELYAKAAPGNYKKTAARFDSLAADFTKAVAITDPDTDAAALVGAPDEQRKAWLDGQQLAHQLSGYQHVLVCAALLAGVNANTDHAGGVLGLVADPGQAHRRQVWTAWNNGVGDDRWNALVRLGVRIRAADLGTYQPYRAPRPLEVRQEQQPGAPRGVIRRVEVDPEDADYSPPQIDPYRPNMVAR
jgi:hypothetical protein